MEDNKLFDLVEKMYADLSSKMGNMESRMDKMEANMATKDDIANMATKDDIANMATKDDIANMVTKDDMANMATKHDIIRLENKMDANHKALYDGYKLTYEKLEVLEEKVTGIEKHVEKHDVEIRVIKSVN